MLLILTLKIMIVVKPIILHESQKIPPLTIGLFGDHVNSTTSSWINQNHSVLARAANKRPTIAQPTQKEADLWEAKQKCSLLTLKARNTTSKATTKERDEACAIARKMTTQ
jgi:hypothetical protein